MKKKSFFILFIIAGVFSIVLYYYLFPISFRINILQPIREISYFKKELDLFNSYRKLSKIGIKAQKIVKIQSNGIEKINIVGELRVPENSKPSKGVLLLHGSSPWGKNSGLMKLLALRFQEQGYVTFSPDARGFGDSDDPTNINRPQLWEVRNDIENSLKFLLSKVSEKPQIILVLGHSMGANHALEGALEDPRVDGLILIGPSRFIKGPDTPRWSLVRFSSDRRLKKVIEKTVLEERIKKSDINFYAKTSLKKTGHKPILLIDGELEGKKKIKFLKGVASKIAEPVTYVTLANTGHYCGVYNLFGSDTIYYQPGLFNELLEKIFEFNNDLYHGKYDN